MSRAEASLRARPECARARSRVLPPCSSWASAPSTSWCRSGGCSSASTKDARRVHQRRTRCGSPTSTSFDNVRELLAYRDGVFLRWMLNSVAYTGGGALLGTAARRDVRLRPGQVPVPGPGGAVQRRARRRAGAGHRAGPAAVPDLQPGRGDQHRSGRSSCPAWSTRSGSTSPASTRPPACPTNCSRPPASTAPARCARSSPCRRG